MYGGHMITNIFTREQHHHRNFFNTVYMYMYLHVFVFCCVKYVLPI